jgi:hypothetical protein
MSKRAVADEFDGLDAIEKAAVEAALNRCRVLADQIESKLRHKRPEHFVTLLMRLRLGNTAGAPEVSESSRLL